MAKATKKKQIGSAFDLLSKSADIVKKNWQIFAIVNILTILGAISKAFGQDSRGGSGWANRSTGNWGGLDGGQLGTLLGLGAVLVLVMMVVGIFLYAMNISLQVKSTAGKKPQLGELFEDGKKYFFRILGVSILSGLIILLGFILLIVPGFIALGRLIMSPYFLVDKNLSVTQAIKASNDNAIGKMGLIYGAIGVSILVAILSGFLGIIPVIGPLAGAAVTIAYSLVIALRYRQIKNA